MRKQIKAHPRITVFILFLIALTVTILIGGYRYHWSWTGFTGTTESYKTLYDWLNLLGVLAVPVVVGFGAIWFTTRQGKVADAENKDNQREAALQAYIDKMSELLLEKKLRDSTEEDEVRKIARVRTLTILSRLDASRKGSVLQFLYESGLINKDRSMIDLSGADLNKTNLSFASMRKVNLSKTKLNEANLRYSSIVDADFRAADFSEADLYHAFLRRADLRYAFLSGTDMRGADLLSANLSEAKLIGTDLSKANLKSVIGIFIEELEKEAKSLQGATMPDGTIHQ